MKNMKKFLAGVLAALTVMSTATAAFADYEPSADSIDTRTAEYLEDEEYYYEDEYYNEYDFNDDIADEPEDPYVDETPDIPSEADETIAIIYLCSVPYPTLHYIFGHSWICIKNVSDEELSIGSQTIAPGEMISAGLHSTMSKGRSGMSFNDEMNDFKGRSVSAVQYFLTEKEFTKMSKEITNSKWSWYELFTHNCTNFAAAVWRAATGNFMLAFCFPFIVSIQMIGAGRITIK